MCIVRNRNSISFSPPQCPTSPVPFIVEPILSLWTKKEEIPLLKIVVASL